MPLFNILYDTTSFYLHCVCFSLSLVNLLFVLIVVIQARIIYNVTDVRDPYLMM